MCGIGGLIRENTPTITDTLARIERGARSLFHRGPDGHGVVYWGASNASDHLDVQIKYEGPTASNQIDFLSLFHTRLSILDLTDQGHQPMVLDGQYWIVHNGEVYNYIESRRELEAAGYSFRTGTDTEVILAAYKHWGIQCLDHFNGMWAFALYDAKENKLILARDRFGVKPLYFTHREGEFAFASEPKALLAMGAARRQANYDALTDFVILGRSRNNKCTSFADIFQVAPGEALVIDLNKELSSKREFKYYSLRDKIKVYQGSHNEWLSDLKDRFVNAVKLRLRSDVEVGACLSGGLDSSAIVGAAHQLDPNFRLKTFTSCFKNPTYDERAFATAVVNMNGSHPHWIYGDEQLLDRPLVDQITFAQDEPFASTSILAQWYIMREANKAGIKVLLDGQGSDEIFGGYHRFIPIYFTNLLLDGKARAAISQIFQMRADNIGPSLSYLGAKIFTNALGIINGNPHGSLDLLNKKSRKSFVLPAQQNRSFHEALITEIYGGLQELLRYEDRNSMAHGIEARTPFLDFNLVEHVFSGKLEWFYNSGRIKHPLRIAAKENLPFCVYNRRDKMGFVTPEKEWYELKLKMFYEDIFNNETVVSTIIDKHWLNKNFESGKIIERGFLLWRIFQANRWAKIFQIN